MRQVATVPESTARPDPQPTPPAPPQSADNQAARRGFYAATRVGKKKVTATLDPADHKRLRRLALDRDSTTEALLAEAIGDLFAKYGQGRVGQTNDAS